MTYTDATTEQNNTALQDSTEAFDSYKKLTLADRAQFLQTVASELQVISQPLLAIAQRETNLEESRLRVELKRTIFQLTSYADACAEGTWLDVKIDTANKQRNPLKPDLRKMLVPLGPVVVFGASNFPFAYSTVGGDTACALAAGCTVILKAHPAHAATSEMVAGAVKRAAAKHHLPESLFIHLHGASFEVGKALVQHRLTRAVAFTGSYEGGKALFDVANGREVPVPVFAEMGSVNPVFLFPQKLKKDVKEIANNYISSITQSVGQFCTNPGILVAINDEAMRQFKQLVGEGITATQPAKMLHQGIAKNFQQKRAKAIKEGAVVVATSHANATSEESIPTLAEVDAKTFLRESLLHKEIFGPYSLLVICKNNDEMIEVASALEGQLTCTLIATNGEITEAERLVSIVKEKCGRLILNGVPTGVEVAVSMHHGGPYPATTDSRFTAVGADGIKRFARPLCFQDWSNDLLPQELKNENPLGIWRTINNNLTKEAVQPS